MASNSESTRTKIKQDKIRYSNYLATQTRFINGLISRPGIIISGTGSSGESSAYVDIKTGTVFISPEDQASIITANAPQPIISGSLLLAPNGYLESPESANFAMGLQDFTIECWAKTSITYGGGWENLVYLGSSNTDDIRLCAGGDFRGINAGNIGIIVPGLSDAMRCYAPLKMTIGNWYHLALVRQGNYVSLYVNGVNIILEDDETHISSTQIGVTFNHGSTNAGKSTFYVNSSFGGERGFNGNVSNVRVVKGTAVYTGNFTVPTAPLGIASDTKILLNTKPDIYINDSSSYNNTVTSTGPVSFSSNNPFTG